jgi:hypothetical protein
LAIRIDVSVRGEEAILRLDSLPRRLREQLAQKMAGVLGTARTDMLGGLPGKYLDPKYINVEVTATKDLLIGTLDAEQKPGFYSIVPNKANVLRFIAKSGDIVFTKRVSRHPFLSGAPAIERYFAENKPWLIEQIEDAVFDVVYS